MIIKSVLLLLITPGSLYSQNPDLSGYSFAIDAGHGGSQTGAVSPFGAPAGEQTPVGKIYAR